MGVPPNNHPKLSKVLRHDRHNIDMLNKGLSHVNSKLAKSTLQTLMRTSCEAPVKLTGERSQCRESLGEKSANRGAPWCSTNQVFTIKDNIIWVNLITTSLRPNPGIMVSKGNHPQVALIQVSEILSFTQIRYIYIYCI